MSLESSLYWNLEADCRSFIDWMARQTCQNGYISKSPGPNCRIVKFVIGVFSVDQDDPICENEGTDPTFKTNSVLVRKECEVLYIECNFI